eukprot:EG_transcript_16244
MSSTPGTYRLSVPWGWRRRLSPQKAVPHNGFKSSSEDPWLEVLRVGDDRTNGLGREPGELLARVGEKGLWGFPGPKGLLLHGTIGRSRACVAKRFPGIPGPKGLWAGWLGLPTRLGGVAIR